MPNGQIIALSEKREHIKIGLLAGAETVRGGSGDGDRSRPFRRLTNQRRIGPTLPVSARLGLLLERKR
jgi:hypothetical protein